MYKPCYPSCKTCNSSGDEINHNCIECNDNYIFELNYSHSKNCYNSSYYYNIDTISTQLLQFTSTYECPKYYNTLIPDKKECIDNCTKDNYYKYEFNNASLTNVPS